MKLAIILRGLPGSGKSKLAAHLKSNLLRVSIHSTDDFFMKDGEYQFDRRKLSQYHEWNLKMFRDSCVNEVPIVICDNTNTQKWEYERYVQVAEALGYEVHVITVGLPKDAAHITECARRNVHGVPLEIICKMSERFEL